MASKTDPGRFFEDFRLGETIVHSTPRTLTEGDLAVYQAFKGVRPGITALGLKEGGVDYAMDEYNAKLVTPEMRKRVDAAKADIIAGKLKVVDYTVANACKP